MLQNESAIDFSSLERFVREEVLPGALERDSKQEVPFALYQKLHDLGWLQAFVPEEMGGVGLSTSDLIHLFRKTAYGSVGLCTSMSVTMLAFVPILRHARKELRDRVVGDFMNRFSMASFGVTEPDVGTNVAHLKSTARKVDGGYILNGRKCFSTNSTISEHLVVFATLEDLKQSRRNPITGFYLPGSAKGLSRGNQLKKLGQIDSDTSELFFEDVFVPAEHLLGEEGGGLSVAFESIQRSKTMFSAVAVGACDRLKDLAVEYLSNRRNYGQKSLLDLPVIHTEFAHYLTLIEASWLMTCRAAQAWDRGQGAMEAASMAKYFACDTAVKFANQVVEWFGGYGVSKGIEVEKLFRDVKMLEIFEGASQVQKLLVAKERFSELGRPRESGAKKS